MLDPSDEIPFPEEYLEEWQDFIKPAVQAEVRRILAEMRLFKKIQHPFNDLTVILENCAHPPDHLTRGVVAMFSSRNWQISFCSQGGNRWIELKRKWIPVVPDPVGRS